MEERRKKHLEKNLIHIDDIYNYNLQEVFPVGSILCMDTESCYINENKNIPIKIYDEKKRKMIDNPNFDFSVKVYAWGVSNSSNDYVVYGEDLKQMFTLFKMIGQSRNDYFGKKTQKKINDIKKNMKLKCFVHNLGWDIEFLKYVLHDMNYNYTLSKLDKDSNKKINVKKQPVTYNIVESNNIVYSCSVCMDDYEDHKFTTKRKGQETIKIIETFTQIEFLDSYKIMAQSLDSIAKQVIKIDEMFYKMGASYDYEKVRKEGHKLDYIEKAYLYNDVYILKEFINQFYIPLNTNQTTASAIAFESFIKDKFKVDKGMYKEFEQIYPNLYDHKKIYEIIKGSYKGGWTQANKRYVGKSVKCNKSVSIDINSSYPSVVRYKPLPFGTPVLHEGKYIPNENELVIYTIHFDGFKNINDDDLIGNIQCGENNKDLFKCNGTEYLHTNFIDGKMCGSNNKSKTHNFKMDIWDFELDNMLGNMRFYSYKRYYDEVLEEEYTTNEIEEGFHIESSLVFNSNIAFFGEQVDSFTEMKIEGKLTNNPAKTAYAKLCLNSFYGKLASNPERMERDLKFKDGLAYFENTDISYLAEKKYYAAFSSCVTAWARVNLRTTLYKIGYNNVLYFDTDSLYTTVNSDFIKNKCGDILHKTELGKWDIEKEYDKFKAIGSKKYILNGKDFGKDVNYKTICKCAGLPADVRKNVTFEDFYLGNTFKGKKSKKRVKGGYTLLEGDYKLNNIIF